MFNKKYYTTEELASMAEKTWDSLKTFQHSQVNYHSYENAIILPLIKSHTPLETYRVGIFEGGVCDENYNFLNGFYLKKGPHEPINLECVKSYKPQNIKTVNETVIFAGYLTISFGLTITDGLTRLWYPLVNGDTENKIAFLLRDSFDPLASFHIKVLELMGIGKDRIIIITEPTKFKRVIVPKQSAFWFEGYDSKLFLAPYNAAINNVSPKGSKKLYLSRSRFEANEIFNEVYFEKFFSSQGYEIIYPEQLDLAEQVAYISGADEIACTYGTLSHMLLFAKPKTKCIFLLRASTLTTDFVRQQIINHSKQLDFVYVDASLNLFPSFHDGYTGYIIGPSHPWQSFVKNELSLNEDIDVYEYFNNLDIKLGDYVKLFLKRTKGRWFFQETFGYRFDYVNYIQSLYSSFEPEGYKSVLNAMKTPDNPVFSNMVFKYKRIDGADCCIIRLCADASVKLIKGEQPFDMMYWAYLKHRLIFLNSRNEPVSEFYINSNENNHSLGRGRTFYGHSVFGEFGEFSIATVSNAVPKAIIKCLVSKKRYKKLKRDPERFFGDSKCPVIKYLQRFYYY